MQELTDDQLDGLFRKSTEEFEPPYDPVAWQAMQGLLDTHNQTAPRPKPVLWKKIVGLSLITLLLLLLTGGGWLVYRQQQLSEKKVISQKAADSSMEPSAGLGAATRSTATKPVASESALPTRVKVAEGSKSKPMADIIAANPAKPSQPTDGLADNDVNPTNERATSERKSIAVPERLNRIATKKAASSAPVRPTSPDVSTRTITKSTHTTAKRATLSAAAASTRAIGPFTTRTYRQNTLAAGRSTDRKQSRSSTARYRTRRDSGLLGGLFRPGPTPLFNNGQLTNQAKSVNDNAVLTTTPDSTMASPPAMGSMPAVAELTNKPGQWPKPLHFTGRQVEQTPLEESTEKVSAVSQSSQKGFSVRLVVSPDLSTIGLKNFQRPGTNYGAMLEYRVAPRWSVQTGVIRSNKVYKAYSTDYELSSSTAGKDLPESISATCNLLDIPINLRYDVALIPRLNNLQPSRWFITGGVTTYLMLREAYTYNYAQHAYNKLYPYPYITDKTSAFGFSQLNVSAGYERAISKRLSWQVEPFLKAPLKGVGVYKINLLSTGAFFSLRYKL